MKCCTRFCQMGAGGSVPLHISHIQLHFQNAIFLGRNSNLVMKIWIYRVFTFGAGPRKGVREIKDFQKISLTESSPTMNKRCLQRAWPPHQIRSKTILLMLKIPDKVNMSIFFLPKIPDNIYMSMFFVKNTRQS